MKKMLSLLAILMVAMTSWAEVYEVTTWADIHKYVASNDSIKLMADIDFQGREVESLSSGDAGWMCFDGNNHTIKNGILKDGYMVKCLHSGTTKNLTFDNISAEYAIIAKEAYRGCCFENLTFNNCSITGSNMKVAMVCGTEIYNEVTQSESGDVIPLIFSDITVKGCVVNGGDNTGTILGSTDFSCNVTNCHVSGTTVNGNVNVGGIAGFISSEKGYIENCSFSGKVFANGSTSYGAYCGGIAGKFNGGSVRNCINNGEIDANEDDAGGIIGSASSASITACKNTGWIHHTNLTGSNDYIGGILGYGLDVQISKCVNEGSIDGGNKYAGGITGYLTGTEEGGSSSITHCVNNGFVNGKTYVGGIAGQITGASTVSYCIGASNRIEGGECTELLVGAEPTGSTSNNYWISEESNIEVGAVTKDDLMSGKVTCHINNKANLPENVWTQNLETDAYPVIGNEDVHYARTMTTEWGTVVLPFDVAYNQSNGNYKLYKLSAADAQNLTFTEYENGNIVAGTPMVVKKISGEGIDIATASTPNFNTTIIDQNSTNASLPAGWTMKATYTEKNVQATSTNSVYYIAEDKFWYADAATKVPAFRGWFTGPAPTNGNAKVFNIIIADDVTGISELRGGSLVLRDGKYLENGKVMIVRNGKKYNLNGQIIR